MGTSDNGFSDEEGLEIGREEGKRSLVLRQLNRRVGAIPDAMLSQFQALSLEQLEALGEALLDFNAIADLKEWLQNRTTE
nr:DUF4351 domain-containing protein [Dendronalium sp. ChiSLP03b]MDZ8208225.1 DUF4351 domain-containing protein [Dendronalium sp. ChiSLP03b]